MSDLKTATSEVHEAAENLELSKMLINGDFTKSEWAAFLSNQYQIRLAIEARDIITNPNLLTVPKLKLDLDEVGSDGNTDIVNSTKEYVEYLSNLPQDLLWSHIYVLYAGDLYGGQVIKKAFEKSGTGLPTHFLDFEERIPLISYIRVNTANADAEEAVNGFNWTIKIYSELYDVLRGQAKSVVAEPLVTVEAPVIPEPVVVVEAPVIPEAPVQEPTVVSVQEAVVVKDVPVVQVAEVLQVQNVTPSSDPRPPSQLHGF